MVTTFRAALSAVMLFGFYVYTFGIVVALGVATVLLFDRVPGAIAGKLGYVTLAMAGAILVGTWKVLRARPKPQPGLVVAEHQAPALWAAVREIAAVVGTRAPDEIRLVPEVNAAVAEDARLLGMRGGRRYLYLGLPLVQTMTVSQLRSVLAHELGHYSHQHTRLGELTYRGSATMIQTINRVGPTTLGGFLLRGYAAGYHLVSAAVSRRQEIEADRAAVRVAGHAATASALKDLPALDAAWDFYLESYVAWGLDSGFAPTGVLAGFPRMLAGRPDLLAGLAGKAGTERRSRYDSHPPIRERVDLIWREPASPAMADDRPAGVLVPDLDGAAAALEGEVLDFGDRKRVSFTEYTAAAATYTAQTEADVLYRAAARVTNERSANLRTVLGLLGAGQRERLEHALSRPAELADRATVPARLRSCLGAALTTALVGAGAAGWRYSWSDAVALVAADGRPLKAEVDELVTAALDGRIGEVTDRLGAAGVDLAAAAVHQATATAKGASAVAGIVNIVVDGKRSDLVILDTGLIVVPGMARMRMNKAKPRLHEMLTSVPPEKLAAMDGHRFIPYEEVVEGRRTRRMPVAFLLRLRDGAEVTLRYGSESEELGEGWKALGTMVGQMEAPA